VSSPVSSRPTRSLIVVTGTIRCRIDVHDDDDDYA